MCSQIEAATLELWSTEMGRTTFEKYYRVKDLAGLWGLSPKTVSGDARLLNYPPNDNPGFPNGGDINCCSASAAQSCSKTVLHVQSQIL